MKEALAKNTRPANWPESAYLRHYLFCMIFKIDCYDIFDNQEELEKVEEEVDELEEPVKDAITTFVNTERQRLENDYGCTIVKSQASDKETDLLRCMGLKKAAPGMGRLETQYGFLVQTTMAARSFPLTDTFSIAQRLISCRLNP